MVMPPCGELVFSALAWISMITYFYLICKLLQSRRSTPQFKSSYYSLFLLQSVADFYVFIFVEFILRPRKFNYFNLFSENMKSFAFFTMANFMFARGVLCSGHIVIALNRLTAFYLPLKQEKIWSDWVVFLSVVSLWILCVVTSIPALIIHHDAPYFFFMQNGVLQMSFGTIGYYYAYQGLVIGVVTVAVCSVCYLFSYRKARGRNYVIVEQRLLICAIVSSFPFCIDMVCSIIMLPLFGLQNDLYKTVASIWFYEVEATVSSSVWLQLIINKSVRDLLLRRLPMSQQKATPLIRISNISVTTREKS